MPLPAAVLALSAAALPLVVPVLAPLVVPVVPLLAPPNPHPVLPAWVCAPRPLQIPHGFAQHPLAQSAALRHWPPMNCVPAPLPMFFVPEGSNGGQRFWRSDLLMRDGEKTFG